MQTHEHARYIAHEQTRSTAGRESNRGQAMLNHCPDFPGLVAVQTSELGACPSLPLAPCQQQACLPSGWADGRLRGSFIALAIVPR